MGIRALPPALAEKARVELNEDPQRVEDSVAHIKQWLTKQPHLRCRTDDQWLVVFLRSCKYSLERTKEKIDLYYTMRTIAPELYVIKHTDPIFTEILDLGVMLMLPKLPAPDAPRVMLFRGGAYDPTKYSIEHIMSVSVILQQLAFKDDDNTTVAGVMSVMDLEGATMAHFLQMSPAMMKKMSVISQDAAPLRMKGGHYLNTPPGFETFYNLFKNFLNEKMKNRLYVHNKNYEELYKHVPKDVLPTEYGGNSGTIKDISEYWKKKVLENSDWLNENQTFGTDESKRPGKPRTAETMFGVEGSFRQLSFD